VIHKLVFEALLLCIKIFVFTRALAIGNGHLSSRRKILSSLLVKIPTFEPPSVYKKQII